jgi:hypothetical protein
MARTEKAASAGPKNGSKQEPRKARGSIAGFRDRLGCLTFVQACDLLGDSGDELLRDGGMLYDIETERDVYLGNDLYRVRVHDPDEPGAVVVTTITQVAGRDRRLLLNCDHCEGVCKHLGAALDHLLQAKSELGLAQPPDPTVPLEHLTAEELRERVLAERRQRAQDEKMTLRSRDPSRPWTDYTLTSFRSGRSYRVALRGFDSGISYCSCPDFRTNRLGTCKHILHALDKVKKRFSQRVLATPYRRKNVSLRVDYGPEGGLRFNLPHRPSESILEFVGPFGEKSLRDAEDALLRVKQLETHGTPVHIYPDAEQWIQARLIERRLAKEAEQIRKDPAKHPLRTDLLKVPLLPYQLDGIAFAVGAGRAVLADDMGLGKTIQGIGVAELLARLADIQRVLVICPASLKSQWRTEIARFSDRSSRIILGTRQEREEQYQQEAFFTICNYEQVVRDLRYVEAIPWDLIILDEGQRIKNWQSKTSQAIRSLDGMCRLVLSGTPLENRLDELYTVVQFVDQARLGPAHEFFHRHRVVNEHGKILGYRQLDRLREDLRPILIRRTRGEVARQLPDRTDQVVRIRPTAEQLEIHGANMLVVSQIIRKKFLTEMDLLRLQKALLMCRMVANSTYLVDQTEPEYSTKMERLQELLEGLLEDPTRKIVIFSEWKRMLNRIEQRLDGLEATYVRLDGSVPQKLRPGIVSRFQEDPDCRAILMTNAGSTGLNLQSANTVINVDLPWNPAVLEQRIARAHRMGQDQPVMVYKLVTEETLEERLLETLAAKQNLAWAALDYDSEVKHVELQGGMEELRRRLEKLITDPVPAPIDASQQQRVEREALEIQSRRERVAAAGGQLLGSALQLVSELIATPDRPAPDPAAVRQLQEGLAQSIQRDTQGRPQLTLTLDNDAALQDLAQTLARLLLPPS